MKGVGIKTVCICASHFLRDQKYWDKPKIIHQTFTFQYMVANPLLSRTDRYTRRSVSPLVLLCQASTATVFSSCLYLVYFLFSFIFSKWNACSNGFRSGDWLGHFITFHFFALHHAPDLDVNTLKLKLNVCSQTTPCLFQFKFIVVVFTAREMRIVLTSQYLWTWWYIYTYWAIT